MTSLPIWKPVSQPSAANKQLFSFPQGECDLPFIPVQASISVRQDPRLPAGGLVIIKKVVQKRLWAFLNLAFTEESAGKRTNMPSAFTTPPVKRQFGKIRRFSRTANYKIFFPLNMRKAHAARIPNRPLTPPQACGRWPLHACSSWQNRRSLPARSASSCTGTAGTAPGWCGSGQRWCTPRSPGIRRSPAPR